MKQKIVLGIVAIVSTMVYAGDDNYPRSIFIPRQLSYNPILEHAQLGPLLQERETWHTLLSIKPLYNQTVGGTMQRYFSVGHQPTMAVQENNSGVINSLWFEVISSNDTFYASTLSFNPVRKTFGALVFFEWFLPYDFALSIDTALITAQHTINMQEITNLNLGTADYTSVAQALTMPNRTYGRVKDVQVQTGLDDIQVKIIKTTHRNDTHSWDLYGLVGIPTSKGTKSEYLFEPIVGSHHVQLGLGTTYYQAWTTQDFGEVSLFAELKWQYGLSAYETRLFDITKNGQWSRYMLFADVTNPWITSFASNSLALNTKVTPKNFLDVYIALHSTHDNWQLEVGYDFWFRSAEKLSLPASSSFASSLGVADLLGMITLDPQTASTANISQGVAPLANQMVSDATFVNLTVSDLSLLSASAPQSVSNSLYGSVAYRYDETSFIAQIGLNAAYEIGHKPNTPDAVYAWINVDVTF